MAAAAAAAAAPALSGDSDATQPEVGGAGLPFPMQEMEVRVLKKRVRCTRLFVIDGLVSGASPPVEAAAPAGYVTVAPASNSALGAGAHAEIAAEGPIVREMRFTVCAEPEGPSEEQVAAWQSSLHVGDTISVKGRWGRPTPLRPEATASGYQAQGQDEGSKGQGKPRAEGRTTFRVAELSICEAHSAIHGTSTLIWPPSHGEGERSGIAGLAPPFRRRLVLQCAGTQAVRLAEYCREALAIPCGLAVPQQGHSDRVLFAQPPLDHDTGLLLRRFTTDANVRSVLRRTFVVETPPIWSMRRAIEELISLVEGLEGSAIVRVQAFPRYLELPVVEALARSKRRIEPVGFTHVASLVYADAAYAVGVTPRAAICPESAAGMDILLTDKPKSPRISRAYAKLTEAHTRSGWAEQLAAHPMPAGAGAAAEALEGGAPLQAGRRRRTALDVGAAPGGWSACLATLWKCDDVWAVDPGELAPELLEVSDSRHGRIRHLQMQWPEAFARLREEDGASAQGSIDILVCDANVPCDQATDLVVSAAQDLLADHAYLVITFKNLCRTASEFEKLKSTQLGRLRELCGPAGNEIREVQLLANRKLETTVLARFVRTSGPTPP